MISYPGLPHEDIVDILDELQRNWKKLRSVSDFGWHRIRFS